MKVTCTIDNLRSSILTIERFTSRHVTLPILAHVLCRADERRIVFIATNLEVGVEYQLPGKIQKPGVVTIPAKSLSQILASLSDETVTIEARQNHLFIRTHQNDITLLGLNPDDFPSLPVIKPEHSLSLSISDLHRALERVSMAAATTDLKPELAGVFLALNSNTLTLVATDAFRLAEQTLRLEPGTKGVFECVIPLKTVQELLRIMPEDSSQASQLSIGEHQATIEWGPVRVLTRLVDSPFPPYQNIIPASYETNLVVKRDELLRNIRLASVFSSRLNDVTLRYSNSELEVATQNPETGSTSSRLTIKGRGVSGSVVFNHRYLMDGLEACGGETAALSLNGSSGPALVQDPDDNSFRYLVMPIRSV